LAKTLVSQSNIRLLNVREAAALTTSYVASDSFNIQGANQLQLQVSFTEGDSDGCMLKIEFSEDKTNWYQESEYTVYETGEVRHKPVVRKILSSSNIVISVPVSASFFRVSTAAIVSGTGTSLSITATIANI
jgi:hypothetical protein